MNKTNSVLLDILLGVLMFYCLPGVLIYQVGGLRIPDGDEIPHVSILFICSTLVWALLGRALGIY